MGSHSQGFRLWKLFLCDWHIDLRKVGNIAYSMWFTPYHPFDWRAFRTAAWAWCRTRAPRARWNTGGSTGSCASPSVGNTFWYMPKLATNVTALFTRSFLPLLYNRRERLLHRRWWRNFCWRALCSFQQEDIFDELRAWTNLLQNGVLTAFPSTFLIPTDVSVPGVNRIDSSAGKGMAFWSWTTTTAPADSPKYVATKCVTSAKQRSFTYLKNVLLLHDVYRYFETWI